MFSLKLVLIAIIATIACTTAAPQPHHKFGFGVPVAVEPVVPVAVPVQRVVQPIVPVVQPIVSVQPIVPVQPVVSVVPVFGRFG